MSAVIVVAVVPVAVVVLVLEGFERLMDVPVHCALVRAAGVGGGRVQERLPPEPRNQAPMST